MRTEIFQVSKCFVFMCTFIWRSLLFWSVFPFLSCLLKQILGLQYHLAKELTVKILDGYQIDEICTNANTFHTLELVYQFILSSYNITVSVSDGSPFFLSFLPSILPYFSLPAMLCNPTNGNGPHWRRRLFE